MFDRLKDIFTTKVKPNGSHSSSERMSTSVTQQEDSLSNTSDRYFAAMTRMQDAIANRDYERAANAVHEQLQHIPDFVQECRLRYGKFDIQSIPALEQGGTILALMGDDIGLNHIEELISSLHGLQPWEELVPRHKRDRTLFPVLLDTIAKHPNCLQTSMKELTGEEDGRRIAHLLAYLEKANRIVRIKAGGTHRLMLHGTLEAPALPKPTTPGSHRSDRSAPCLREVDISSIQYIPLPRSPLRWEEKEVRSEHRNEPIIEAFQTRDTITWRIEAIETVPKTDRVDPAFRQIHPTNAGVFMIDDRGNAEGFGQIQAAVLRYDRHGCPTAKAGLSRDMYRLGVHPLGRGLVTMSRECVLSAYSESLELLFETPLRESPEIVAFSKRLRAQPDSLKNHIRCVALSQDAGRYLFSVMDEAWCVSSKGVGLWGIKLPLKEGWARIATHSTSIATSTEIAQALLLMNLSLPITPEDVKRSYRELAKRWHPDLNPNEPAAEERMKRLNCAAEVLTGLNLDCLPDYAGASFARELHRTQVIAGEFAFTMTISQNADEATAPDWIYAASFAGRSNAAYIAGYSGRVVQVDDRGHALRVYDIGSVPRQIIDTGDYLYILTDTRLYILRDDALCALIDTLDRGDFLAAETGFGLLEKNRIRWYSEDGFHLGTVLSKDPIRRVYHSPRGMIVESRQRRAIVQGIAPWWSD